jgi:hypothetical protein
LGEGFSITGKVSKEKTAPFLFRFYYGFSFFV